MDEIESFDAISLGDDCKEHLKGEEMMA